MATDPKTRTGLDFVPVDLTKKPKSCAPIAWTLVTGLPFERVFAELQGYQPKEKIEKCGTRIASSIKFAKRHGYELVGKNCLYHPGLPSQLLRAVDLPRKPVVALVRGHAVAVVDHVVYGTWDCRGKRSRKLMGYFVKRYQPS